LGISFGVPKKFNDFDVIFTNNFKIYYMKKIDVSSKVQATWIYDGSKASPCLNLVLFALITWLTSAHKCHFFPNLVIKLSHTSSVLVFGIREYVLGFSFYWYHFGLLTIIPWDKLGVCHNKHNKLCSHLNYANENLNR
jgi:hypothetical protein